MEVVDNGENQNFDQFLKKDFLLGGLTDYDALST